MILSVGLCFNGFLEEIRTVTDGAVTGVIAVEGFFGGPVLAVGPVVAAMAFVASVAVVAMMAVLAVLAVVVVVAVVAVVAGNAAGYEAL